MSQKIRQNMPTLFQKGMQIPLKRYGCESYVILNLARCVIVIHAVFWKFEYPCETRLPGYMRDPILMKKYWEQHHTLRRSLSLYMYTCICLYEHASKSLHLFSVTGWKFGQAIFTLPFAVHLDLPMWGQIVGIPQNGIFPVGIELSSIVGM